MKRLIGLCGAAGAGKDTVAAMLPCTSLAFADRLYEEVSEGFDRPESALRGRQHKELPTKYLSLQYCRDDHFLDYLEAVGILDGDAALCKSRSPRQILQLWADYRRAEWSDYFIHALDKRLYGLNSAVITDVRFPNEVDLIRSYGGELWQVQRPGYIAGGTGHVSDTDGTEFKPDRIIINDGTVNDLEIAVIQAVRE